MTDYAGLVDYAEQVLDGKVPLGASAPRTAALLARCALEEWLDERSASWSSGGYPYPSTVSKLIALAALEGDELRDARQAAVERSESRRAPPRLRIAAVGYRGSSPCRAVTGVDGLMASSSSQSVSVPPPTLIR